MKHFAKAFSGTLAVASMVITSALTVSTANGPALALEIMSLHLHPRANGVIGADDRVPLNWGKPVSLSTVSVGHTRHFSTKKVVRLLDSSGKFICTGSVVGPTTILTAAHCLYWDGNWRARRGGRPMFAKIWDGRRFALNDWHLLKRYNGYALRPTRRATTLDQYAIDVAMVSTSKKISNAVGGFLGITKRNGWGLGRDTSLNTPMYLIGFHGDVETQRPERLVLEDCNGEYRSSSLVILVKIISDLGRIEHRCDSAGGSSGSPLLTDSGNGFHIFGVHVAGNYKKGLGMHPGAKQHQGIFRWLYNMVREDREKHGYRVEEWNSNSVDDQDGYLTSDFQGPKDVRWLRDP